MKFTNLVRATIDTLLNRETAFPGIATYEDVQKTLKESQSSLLTAIKDNQSLLLQTATIDFLRSEQARLWDERQKLIDLQTERQIKANRLASKGFVKQSNEYEQETNHTVGKNIMIVNEKIKGLRIALDHALHAGGNVLDERSIAPLDYPTCYYKGDRISDNDSNIVIPLDQSFSSDKNKDSFVSGTGSYASEAEICSLLKDATGVYIDGVYTNEWEEKDTIIEFSFKESGKVLIVNKDWLMFAKHGSTDLEFTNVDCPTLGPERVSLVIELD